MTTKEPTLILAEFNTPGEIIHAAEMLRDAGYKKFEAHTPFPIHGMDKAMGLPDSRVGWIVLVMGITGLASGIALITYANSIAYAYIVGGKPAFSIPSMVPVCFELTVLFSAFGAVFGMLGLNKLPRHHHPVFESKRFEAATDDKYFISVERDDPNFDAARTRGLLESAKASHIELIEESP